LSGVQHAGYLLDTCIVLQALSEPDELTSATRKAVLAGPNYLSVVSYWEIMLKSMKGALDVGDPRAWWAEALNALAAVPLLLRAEHVAGIYVLPPIHKDPFDRALIAQARAEDLTLVSVDGEIARYAPEALRLIR
jgi:PIN domain nuclease of toxin-antitoxin system